MWCHPGLVGGRHLGLVGARLRAAIAVEAVGDMPGDCWNVNPVALRCVERLYCGGGRALVEARLTVGGIDDMDQGGNAKLSRRVDAYIR